jgi:hypothetical protein
MLRHRMLILVCAIPLVSVLLGIVMIVLAQGSPDAWIETTLLPLSKTNP